MSLPMSITVRHAVSSFMRLLTPEREERYTSIRSLAVSSHGLNMASPSKFVRTLPLPMHRLSDIAIPSSGRRPALPRLCSHGTLAGRGNSGDDAPDSHAVVFQSPWQSDASLSPATSLSGMVMSLGHRRRLHHVPNTTADGGHTGPRRRCGEGQVKPVPANPEIHQRAVGDTRVCFRLPDGLSLPR